MPNATPFYTQSSFTKPDSGLENSNETNKLKNQYKEKILKMYKI